MREKRDTSSYKRKRKFVRPSPFFIIVCEGEVTEVDYFKGFPYYHKLGAVSSSGQRYSHASVHIKGGAGRHEILIQNANKFLSNLKKQFGSISANEVWCVFDCDNNTPSLNRAIQAAKSKKFNSIYSVQCFELWYLLHFQNLSTAIDKNEYDKRISSNLSICYSHGMRGMYILLEKYQEDAIKTAKQLWEQKEKTGKLHEDPVTNVFQLVEALNKAYTMLKDSK